MFRNLRVRFHRWLREDNNGLRWTTYIETGTFRGSHHWPHGWQPRRREY